MQDKDRIKQLEDGIRVTLAHVHNWTPKEIENQLCITLANSETRGETPLGLE